MNILGWLKRLFSRRTSDEEVEQGYLRAGGLFGDAVSYLYMGECIGFSDLLDAWAQWEREYAERGYRTISLDSFIDYGGYNKPIMGLRTKRDEDEEPIYHAQIYRERFLGKVKPALDLNAVMEDRKVHFGTYVLPSTEESEDEDPSHSG